MDEPTGNLDADNADSIHHLLDQLNRQYGLAFVLVTHDMLSMPKFCDRGILLESGKITDEGTPQQVVHNYLSRVERLLALRADEQQELKARQVAAR